MNFIKIFGWVLLVAGIAIIGWTLMSSYNIFTGKAAPPEIFALPEKEPGPLTREITSLPDIQAEMERSLRAPLSSPASPPPLEEEVRQMIGEQLKGILHVDTLPKLLNLAVWSMLAFILIFGGSQISGLGIKLIKK